MTEQQSPAPPRAHVIATRLVVILPALAVVGAGLWIWRYGWMGWSFVYLLLGGWVLTGLGITVGFHRLLTHRSFETKPWLRALLTTVGGLALQGSPLGWCAVHRKHHRFSDADGDPHSPTRHAGGWRNAVRAFSFAHSGWISGPDILDAELQGHYVPDLLEDRFVVWMDQHYYFWLLATLGIPALIGGLITMSASGVLLGFLWGGLIRLFVTNHVSWAVNSVCHLFGSRPYKTQGQARNNVLMALLSHGEGWHNNHHAFPASARHGLRWWQLDVSWLCIRALELCGLAWNVNTPGRDAMRAKRARPSTSAQ